MKRNSKKTGRISALARLGLVASALYIAPALSNLSPASASGGGGSGGGMGGGSGVISIASDPVTMKECGECHIPYSPRYLSDGSWRQIMNNLPDHFGDDASLDADTQQQITQYLTSNAGGRGMGALRITETRWWVSEHWGKFGGWALQTVGRKSSNCAGCHTVLGPQQYGNSGNQNGRSWGW